METIFRILANAVARLFIEAIRQGTTSDERSRFIADESMAESKPTQKGMLAVWRYSCARERINQHQPVN